MVVLFRVSLHHRPPLMYVLFGGYAGFIAYQIARSGGPAQVIPQIVVLAFFTYWSSQWLFPTGMCAPDIKLRYLPTIHESY